MFKLMFIIEKKTTNANLTNVNVIFLCECLASQKGLGGITICKKKTSLHFVIMWKKKGLL